MKMGLGIALLSLCAAAGSAQAVVVDLTTANASGTINGAIYQNFNITPAGSGNLNSFVRISTNGNIVQGYNTSGRPVAFNENTSPTFTHDLTFGEIPTVTVAGVQYKEFLLDINQTNADPLLTLNQVIILSSGTGGQTTSSVYSLGTVRYEMNVGAGTASGPNSVELNYALQSGSGQADMYLYVPLTAFAGLGAGDFIYLYSRFGDPNNNNDGYEEWATRGGEVVPLPPAVWAGGASLFGIALARKARRRSAT
jgi:hypothetical protein